MLSPLSWSPEQAKGVLNCGSKFSQLQTVDYQYLVFDNQSKGGSETATYKKLSSIIFMINNVEAKNENVFHTLVCLVLCT